MWLFFVCTIADLVGFELSLRTIVEVVVEFFFGEEADFAGGAGDDFKFSFFFGLARYDYPIRETD